MMHQICMLSYIFHLYCVYALAESIAFTLSRPITSAFAVYFCALIVCKCMQIMNVCEVLLMSS